MASPRLPYYPELKTNRLEISDVSTPAMGTSREADRINTKTLDFEVEILDAVFNRPGRYFVKMTIQSLATKDYSKILLRKWPDETINHDYEALSSVVYQRGTENEPELCVFEDKKFTFRLPAGFCMNDRNHDVYLLLEAFSLPSNDVDAGKKMGEGKMAIYPRTDAPRTNHLVNPGEDMYRHTTIVSLLRSSTRPGKAEMHCGRMRCSFALREFDIGNEQRKRRGDEDRRKREAEEKLAAEKLEDQRLEAERRREIARLEAEKRRAEEEEKRRRQEDKRRRQEDEEGNKRLEEQDGYLETPFQVVGEDVREQNGCCTPFLKRPNKYSNKDSIKARPKVARTPGPYDRGPAGHPSMLATPASEWGETTPLRLTTTPPSPPPPPPLELRKSIDSPLRDTDNTSYTANQAWRHTARAGSQQIDIIIHGASNLPNADHGKIPQPFASVKTQKDMDTNRQATCRTHAVVRPTNAPSWEEMVTIEVDDKDLEKEALVLAVGDAITRNQLITYSIPLNHLKAFHQYHLELMMPARGSHEGVKLYASIMRKLSSLPKDLSSPNYLGLEVFLRGIKLPLQNPVGPLIAVARIVPDYYNYKSDNLMSNPRAAGVTMFNVPFPNPQPQAFTVTGRSSHGYPQLSLLGRPEEQPKWNHPYLFCDEKDKATIFTPTAALVIEYYVANAAMTDEFWRIRSPIGFSSLLLDQKAYKQLSQEKSKMGLRVEGVPIMGSELRCTDTRAPVVGMVLKLITTHQPESLVAMSNLDNLPSMQLREGLETAPHTADVLQIRTPTPQPLENEPSGEREGDGERGGEEKEDFRAPGMYLQKKDKTHMPIKDGELPPYDAVESVLPEYQYIFVEPNQDTSRSTKQKTAPPSRHVHPPDRGAFSTAASTAPRDTVDLEQTHMSVLDHQMRDLDNHRNAVQKMGQDILMLRNQVRTLEGENSNLRISAHHYDDQKKLLIDASDLDTLARPELQARYASLRQRFAQTTNDLKEYKTRVQKLQNELIKKNDKEKDYLKMSHMQASQQDLLQRLQEKIQKLRKLEDTCKKQEQVIEKLEAVLYKMKDRTGKKGAAPGGEVSNPMNEANNVLVDENKRLREQIDDLKDQLTRAGIAGGEDLEKLELYQALERAEGRIMSLERQLTENARNWGKEKADLTIRSNEAEHGFGRTDGMALHDYPVFDSYTKPYSVASRLGPLFG